MEHKRLKWLWFFQGWHVNLRKIWSVSLAPGPPLYLEKFALLQLRTVVKAVYIIVINSVNRNNFLPDPFRFYHIFGYPSYFVTCREVINFITHQVNVILVITTGSWEQVLGAWVFEEKMLKSLQNLICYTVEVLYTPVPFIENIYIVTHTRS